MAGGGGVGTAPTRWRTLDAALELFLADGYLGTTIDAVARRAGVSIKTVYNAVGGKPALLRAVYDVSLAGRRHGRRPARPGG